jgi:hypothetical protein
MRSILLGPPQHANSLKLRGDIAGKSRASVIGRRRYPNDNKTSSWSSGDDRGFGCDDRGCYASSQAVEYAKRAAVPNIHTYGEQSSIGNPFDVAWIWFQSVVLPML